jgi:hypothetical protein
VIQGRVLRANGTPWSYATVRLLYNGGELARAEAAMNGSFKFTGLAAGVYAIAIGEGAPVVTDIKLAQDATIVRDVKAPAGPAKVLAHALLFARPPSADKAGYAEARVLLGLASQHLSGEVACTFSIEEAQAAVQVTIVGDRVPASAENTLRDAGCQVTRLTGDVYEVAAALVRLFAEG